MEQIKKEMLYKTMKWQSRFALGIWNSVGHFYCFKDILFIFYTALFLLNTAMNVMVKSMHF